MSQHGRNIKKCMLQISWEDVAAINKTHSNLHYTVSNNLYYWQHFKDIKLQILYVTDLSLKVLNPLENKKITQNINFPGIAGLTLS